MDRVFIETKPDPFKAGRNVHAVMIQRDGHPVDGHDVYSRIDVARAAAREVARYLDVWCDLTLSDGMRTLSIAQPGKSRLTSAVIEVWAHADGFVAVKTPSGYVRRGFASVDEAVTFVETTYV